MTTRSRILHAITWRRTLSAIVLLLSVAFLAHKAYTGWDALRAHDWQIRYQYLIPSLLLFLVQLVTITFGWQLIMNHLSKPLPFREHLRIYSYTNLMRRIPAGLLWLVTGRAYAYRGRAISARLTAAGSFLEYLLAILTGFPIAALACSAFGFMSPLTSIALAIVALILALIAIHPALVGKLLVLVKHETLPAVLHYRTTLTWALIYALVWPISGVGLWLIACMFVPMTLEQIPQAIGAMTLSSLVAYVTLLSPSGLGVKELSLTLLLSTLLPDPVPLLVALAIRVIWTAYDLLIGSIAWAL